ncbi:MAG: RDD family protein [Chloroflexi bacterium]|nr:RDD family protein [Chloroflexota bacterium]
MKRPTPKPAAPPKAYQSLQGHYAGFISRLFAFFIDTTIISLTVVSITWFIQVTLNTFRLDAIIDFISRYFPLVRELVDFITRPLSTGLATSMIIPFVYNVFFWVFTGQTPGKSLLGLRIVTLQGKKLSIWRAVLRYLGYYLSILPLFIGFLWVLADDNRQSWHDKIAGTIVVYAWAARPDELFLKDEINQVTGSHKP